VGAASLRDLSRDIEWPIAADLSTGSVPGL
jgi:hypothetical protein